MQTNQLNAGQLLMGVLSNEQGKMSLKILDTQFSFSNELQAQNRASGFGGASNVASVAGNASVLELFGTGAGNFAGKPVQSRGNVPQAANPSCRGCGISVPDAEAEAQSVEASKTSEEGKVLERVLPRGREKISKERVTEDLYFTDSTASEKIMAFFRLPAETRTACKNAADSQGRLSIKEVLTILRQQQTSLKNRIQQVEPEVPARTVRLLLQSLQYRSRGGTPVSCKVQPLTQESYNLREFVDLLDQVVGQVHQERSRKEALSLPSMPQGSGSTATSSQAGQASGMVQADHVERMADSRLPSFCEKEGTSGILDGKRNRPAVLPTPQEPGDKGRDPELSAAAGIGVKKRDERFLRMQTGSDEPFPDRVSEETDPFLESAVGTEEGIHGSGVLSVSNSEMSSKLKAVPSEVTGPRLPEFVAWIPEIDSSEEKGSPPSMVREIPPSAPQVQSVETTKERHVSPDKSLSSLAGMEDIPVIELNGRKLSELLSGRRVEAVGLGVRKMRTMEAEKTGEMPDTPEPVPPGREHAAKSLSSRESQCSNFSSDQPNSGEEPGCEGQRFDIHARSASENTPLRHSSQEAKVSAGLRSEGTERPVEVGSSREGYVSLQAGIRENMPAGKGGEEVRQFSLLDASWPQELTREFQELTARKGTQLTLELEPKNLGRLTLTVETDRNQVTAWVSTETEQARVLLSQHTSELRQCMQGQGLVLGQFHVGVKDHKFNGSFSRQSRPGRKVGELGRDASRGYAGGITSSARLYGTTGEGHLLSVVT